jgi:hypothetical protein
MGTTRDRLLAAFSLLFGFGMLAYGLAEYRDFIADDAYITLRYARNWMAGLGPVWNPGERVEGYTSFLMLALVTALGSLGLDLVAAAHLVDFVSLAALVLYLFAFLRSRVRRDGASEVAAAVSVMLVVGSFPLAIWVWGAMEGTLFAFLCTAGLGTTVALLERPAGWRRALAAGVTLALAVLTRPDGALFLGFAGIALASGIPAHGRLAARQLGIVVLTSAAMLVPHLVWRFSYYGAWLPNSVVAKTTGLPGELPEQGLSYVVGFLTMPPFVALLGFGGFVLALRKTPRDRGLYLLLVSTVVYLALVARVGGDYLPASRFFAPLIPLFGLLVFRGLEVVLRAASWRSAVAAVVAAAGLLILQPRYFAKQDVSDPAGVVGTLIGRHIADKWAPGTRVALHTAGSTPYFAPAYVYIDMLGLNDAHIARRQVEAVSSRWQLLPGHTKGDGRYVLERDPDIIIAGPAQGTTIDRPWFLSDFELASREEFRERYRLRVDRIEAPRRPDLGQADFLNFTYYERVPRSATN